jgi:hypothetical protein
MPGAIGLLETPILLIAAFLLGNLRDSAQARTGIAIVVSGAAIVVYNDPSSSPGDFVFTPVLFAIAWLAGFALRERAAQAEAAEQRRLVEVKGESSNRSSYAKAAEDTPSSNDLRVVCHPKLEERRMVGDAGIEPATPPV